MQIYFDLVADAIPNSDGELHLEPVNKEEIWKEYVCDMDNAGEKSLSLNSFRSMWKVCFPYVKVREYKAVTGKCMKFKLPSTADVLTGKCMTCACLSHARREFRDRDSRSTITYMHAQHRTAYMGERREYAVRKLSAITMPMRYLSIISDGMAQSHCQLPWLGNTLFY